MKRTLQLVLLLTTLGTGCGKEEVLLVGTLDKGRVELAAPISETVLEIPAQTGTPVTKGEVIVQLNPAITAAQYQAAQARAELAKLDFVRGRRLMEQAVISEEEYDRLSHVSAEKSAQAEELKARLEELTLRAPMDAVIDALPFEVGERPRAGEVVGVLVSTARPFARIYVPEGQMARIHPGDQAEVRVDGVDGWLKARVRTIAQTASFTPHYALTDRERSRLVYETEVEVIDERAALLRIGVPLEVRLFPADR